MIYKHKKVFLFLLILIIGVLVGAVVESTDLPPDTPVITSIDVEKVDDSTEIQIDSNSQISYTIYSPEDPYKVVVELQGVSLGKFTDKIVIDKAGVAEIIPSIAEGTVNTARLEIVLAVPAKIKPIQKEKTLILTFYNPEVGEEDESASEEVTLDLKAGFEPIKDATVINNIKLSTSEGKVNVLVSGDGKMSPKV
ncbi:MAG: AMIN domain-containing protein, partial [Bacteroidia bacterium]|nr:AMIN domain-containing protein [Bacteroidia bacterium]